jgi:hypothetical protein
VTRPETPTNLPGEPLEVDAAVVNPAHETNLPTGEPVTEHTLGPSDVDRFFSE